MPVTVTRYPPSNNGYAGDSDGDSGAEGPALSGRELELSTVNPGSRIIAGVQWPQPGLRLSELARA